MTRELLTGGEAVAHAMRQIDPDVVPVYPITPQTPIIQTFAKFVADGRAHTEVVNVESEHSAMSAAIGAALSGARTMTATSSQGLALMAEIVYIAASMRAPIVMAVGNRALSGPINIHCDHSDSMLVRDSGVVQLFAENAQEAYDLTVLAPRIAEHPDVLLPVLVCQDGFTITHSAEPVELLPDDTVRTFVGEYRIPHSVLDAREPDDARAFCDAGLLLRAATSAGRSAASGFAGLRGSGRRVRAAHGPPVLGPRGVSARGCFASARRARLDRRHDQGRDRRVARRRDARRAAQARLVSALPHIGGRLRAGRRRTPSSFSTAPTRRAGRLRSTRSSPRPCTAAAST